jgi:hypothetical protein
VLVPYLSFSVVLSSVGRGLCDGQITRLTRLKKPPVCEVTKGPYKDCKKAKNRATQNVILFLCLKSGI